MTKRDELIELGNRLGESGHPDRELVIQAAYDLDILVEIGRRMLPDATKEFWPLKEAFNRWAK